MSETTPTHLRGLIIPDKRITFERYSAALSTATQAGPLPGVPVATVASNMELVATGRKDAVGTANDITIRAQRGGHVGPDGATFVWRYGTEAVTEARGWDPPIAISGWEAISYTTTANRWRNFHAITLQDGTVLVACMKDYRYVVVWSRNPTTGAWTENAVYDNSTTYTYAAFPTILQLPSGRVMVFFWTEGTTKSQIQAMYAETDLTGFAYGTWTVAQKACLDTAIVSATQQPDRLRAVYLNGQILMVGHLRDASKTYDDILVQWASADLGMTFCQVDIWAGDALTTHAALPDLCVYNGTTAVLGYLRETSAASGDAVPYVRRISSAYTPFSDAEAIPSQSSGNPMRWAVVGAGRSFGSSGDYAIWADDDGTLYQTGRDIASGYHAYVHRSTDGGLTWSTMGDTAAAADGAHWWFGDGATYPKDFAACAQGGRSLIIHRFEAAPGSADDSICCAYLGGFTTVMLPATSGESINRTAWERNYLPFDLPDDTAGVWTLTTGGAPTITLTHGYLSLVTAGGGDSVSYATTTAPPGTLAQGVEALFEMSTTGSAHAFGAVRSGDATPIAYQVRVELTGTSLVLRDLFAGADIATVAVTPAGLPIQVLIEVNNSAGVPANNGNCKAWYRRLADGSEDRKWTLIGSSSTLTSSAVATSQVQFGIISGGGASTNLFRLVSYVSGAYTNQRLYSQTNPTDLLGRAFSASPSLVIDGVKVAAIDGPAYRGDEWTVPTRYTYGVENLHHEVSSSPRQEWRSTASGVELDLVWNVSASLESPQLGQSLGLYLGGINFRDFTLWGYAGGAYTLIGTGNAANGQTGLEFVRDGDTIRPNATVATSTTDYYPFGILSGSYWRQLGFAAAEVIRKITVNGEGAWSGTTATKRVLLQVESSALDASTGADGEIWSKEAALIKNNAGSGLYSRYRLRIPAQTTAEGYYKIGVMILGHVAWFGQPHDWARSQTWQPNFEMTTSRSGTRKATSLGPTRRRVQVAWSDGVDTSQMYASTPAPDWFAAYTSGPPAAAPADTPLLVAGLVEYLEGVVTPVVYLPRVARESLGTTNIKIVGRSGMLYGRITSAEVSVDTVFGEELTSPAGEFVRVSAVTIEEET